MQTVAKRRRLALPLINGKPVGVPRDQAGLLHDHGEPPTTHVPLRGKSVFERLLCEFGKSWRDVKAVLSRKWLKFGVV